VNVKGFRTASILGLALALSALWPAAVGAAGGTVEVEHQRGPLVNAWFTSFDTSGCVETDTFVSANQPTDHHQADQVSTVVASVSVFVYDLCTETALLDAAGYADDLSLDHLTVSNQMDAASLDAVIPLTDIATNEIFDVQVDVAWTGTSDIHRDHSNTNDQYPGGCHVLNRWNGSGRSASAWGSVSDGVTNFTPDATDQAEIGAVHDGFVVIGCA
jgi:hypothetical protein